MKANVSAYVRLNLALILLVLLAMLCKSCKKDDSSSDNTKKSFADMTLNDVKAKESSFTDQGFVISNSGGVVFKAGDLMVYKTSLGNFGKLEVVSVDAADNYKLTIKALTYNADGTTLAESSSMPVRGTWLCDLDTMTEVVEDGSGDFWNERINATDTQFVPKNGAVFLIIN